MSTRTVRLDDEAEATLAKLQKLTGFSISELLKQGLVSLERTAEKEASRRPYDIYKDLDLGPGGYSAAPARDAKTAVREAIAKKHRRGDN